MDKDFILSEIRRSAEKNDGIPLGRNRFLQETGIREIDWKGKFWINWSDAIIEAGFIPQEFNKSFSDDEILRKAARFVRELGHFPQIAELNMKRNSDESFPSEKTFRRFGKKPFFAKAVYDWCVKKDGWDDVATLCEGVKDQASIEVEPEVDTSEPEKNGFVYLMKSGKYYKIGHTNNLDRRQYEIGIQLPEGIEPIHSIATDDPSGIESYWHRRFEAKRMNGEWFNLSLKDISAFKRRKFM